MQIQNGIYCLEFLQGKADFDNIPQTVETDTASIRQTITNDLDSFVQTIDDGLKEITKLSDDVSFTQTCTSSATHVHSYTCKSEKKFNILKYCKMCSSNKSPLPSSLML